MEGSRWRRSSFGWSPPRWFRPLTVVLRVSALTAPTRAHYRYDYAPARYPGARPEPAQRTAGVLRSACCLSTGQSSGSWGECSKDPFGSRCTPHYYHSKKLSTTTPFGVFQIPVGVPTHSLNSNSCPRHLPEPTILTTVHLTITFTGATQMGIADSGPPILSAA